MTFEAWPPAAGEAPEERRIATTSDRNLALTHNLGGYPGEMVSFVSIVGSEPSRRPGAPPEPGRVGARASRPARRRPGPGVDLLHGVSGSSSTIRRASGSL